MEELTPEKLEEMLSDNNNSKEACLKHITDNISEELKSIFNMFMSNDYLLYDLSRDDIDQIMKFYNKIELKIIQEIGENDKETLMVLQLLKLEFMLNLNRAFNPVKSDGDFFSVLNLSLRRR
jgi:hypothetical protein